MTPGGYLAFLTMAVVVVLIPGPDFAVVARNTLVGGRRQGWATAAGIAAACLLQGTAAVAGLGAIVVASHAVFEAVRWAGVGYLAFLALQAWRSAWRGEYPPATIAGAAGRGFRQGFLSNITNPKVLVFYLAILPQFMGSGGLATALLLAVTHAVVGLAYLMMLAALLHRVSDWLSQRRVRRTLDALTGTALGGFGVALALDHS